MPHELICARIAVALAYGAACAYGGYALRDSAERPEVVAAAPEKRQTDDSLVLAREPTATPVSPPHKLPVDSAEERRVVVRVQPDAPAPADSGDPCPAPKPLTLTLSLVRDGEGGRRVIASGEGGRVLGGVDVPIVERSRFVNHEWAAGVGYDLLNEAVGARVDKDFSHNTWFLPNRVSVDAMLGDFDGDGRRDDTAVRGWALWRFGGR